MSPPEGDKDSLMKKGLRLHVGDLDIGRLTGDKDSLMKKGLRRGEGAGGGDDAFTVTKIP